MSGDPLVELAVALRRLHRLAGEPSSHTIGTNIGYSHTTVAKALKCKARPTWPVLSAIVGELRGNVDDFRNYWIAVRDREDPLPPIRDNPPGSEPYESADAVDIVSHPKAAEDRIVLRFRRGQDSFEFFDETLALRWIEARIGRADGND